MKLSTSIRLAAGCIALCALSMTASAQSQTDAQGNIVEVQTIRWPDGRIKQEVEVHKDPTTGKTLWIRTIEHMDEDHPWVITGGSIQDFRPDHPSFDWDPKNPGDSEGNKWVRRLTNASNTGLLQEQFTTLKGTVIVNLPNDLAAGDTISGTVIAEPAGRNDAERARNSDELNGYVVQIGDKKTRVGDGWDKWLIPAALALPVILLDHHGHAIGHQTCQILSSPPPSPQLALPGLGQAGHPIWIPGPFDGDSSNTTLKVGGQSAVVVAESPRGAIAVVPRDVIGSAPIELHSGSTSATGTIRVVALRLTAPRTTLLHGESTSLTVTVSGLDGIDNPVSVRVINRSPGTVRMGGGDDQLISFTPSQTGANGTASRDLGLTGLQPGSFSVGAELCQNAPIQPGYDLLQTSPEATISPAEAALRAVFHAEYMQAKADKEKAKDPNSKEAKDAQKASDEADTQAAASMMGMSASERADIYRRSARAHQKEAERCRKTARDLRQIAEDSRNAAVQPGTSSERSDQLNAQAAANDKAAAASDSEAKAEDEAAKAAEAKANAQGK